MGFLALTKTKKKYNANEQKENYMYLYCGVDKACRTKVDVTILINKRLKINCL